MSFISMFDLGGGTSNAYSLPFEALREYDRTRDPDFDYGTTDVFEMTGDNHTWHRNLSFEQLDARLQSRLAPSVRYIFLGNCKRPPSHNNVSGFDPAVIRSLEREMPVSIAMRRMFRHRIILPGEDVVTNFEQDGDGDVTKISSFTCSPLKLFEGQVLDSGMWSQHGHEWCCIKGGMLTVLVARCDHQVMEEFVNLTEHSPRLASYPLCFDFLSFHVTVTRAHAKYFDRARTAAPMFELSQRQVQTDTLHGEIGKLFYLGANCDSWGPIVDNLLRIELALQSSANTAWTDGGKDWRTIGGVNETLLQSKQRRLAEDLRHLVQKMQMGLSVAQYQGTLAEARAGQALTQQSRDLTQYTVLLAQQTTKDSASMITIAAVTMFFLPATFVSSLFSMGFFAFDEAGTLSISGNVWLYPAIVLPLTMLVFGTWLSWIKVRPNKVEEEVKKLGLTIRRRETAEVNGGDQALAETTGESDPRTKVKDVFLKWLHGTQNLLGKLERKREIDDEIELQ